MKGALPLFAFIVLEGRSGQREPVPVLTRAFNLRCLFFIKGQVHQIRPGSLLSLLTALRKIPPSAQDGLRAANGYERAVGGSCFSHRMLIVTQAWTPVSLSTRRPKECPPTPPVKLFALIFLLII